MKQYVSLISQFKTWAAFITIICQVLIKGICFHYLQIVQYHSSFIVSCLPRKAFFIISKKNISHRPCEKGISDFKVNILQKIKPVWKNVYYHKFLGNRAVICLVPHKNTLNQNSTNGLQCYILSLVPTSCTCCVQTFC